LFFNHKLKEMKLFTFFFNALLLTAAVSQSLSELNNAKKVADTNMMSAVRFIEPPRFSPESCSLTGQDNSYSWRLRFDKDALHAINERDFDPSEVELTSSGEDGKQVPMEFKILETGLLHFELFKPCFEKHHLYVFPWGKKFPYISLLIPVKCKSCYSADKKYLVANHDETRSYCGGRRCKCNNGVFTCNDGCVKRREYSRLRNDPKGNDERQMLIDAMFWVHDECVTGSNKCGTFDGSTEWTFNDMIQHHLTYSSHAHGTSKFLPWHRYYLRDFEKKLQLYHPCVTLPYWDWTMDSGDEANAHVWDSAYFGYPNNADLGQFSSGWTLPASFGTFGRGGFTGLNFGDDVAVTNLLAIGSYSSFRLSLEGAMHGSPHVYIGGQMGDFRSSAEPFFWLHHAMVDKIWYDWQYQNGAVNMNSYDSSTSSQLSPQWGDVEVGGMFDSKEGEINVCYQEPFIISVGKWDFLRKLNVTALQQITRVLPKFFNDDDRRRLRGETQEDGKCGECSVLDKIPSALRDFWYRVGIDEGDMERVLCYLYNNGKVQNIRQKGAWLYDDKLLRESGYPISVPKRDLVKCEKYNGKRRQCLQMDMCKYVKNGKLCVNK
jgi:hypothetical protein